MGVCVLSVLFLPQQKALYLPKISSCMSCAQIERRMELVRVVSHNTHKKMVSCLQGHIGAEAEKRHVSHQACGYKTC